MNARGILPQQGRRKSTGRQVAGGRRQAAGGRRQVAGGQVAGGRWQAQAVRVSGQVTGDRWQVAGAGDSGSVTGDGGAGGRCQVTGVR